MATNELFPDNKANFKIKKKLKLHESLEMINCDDVREYNNHHSIDSHVCFSFKFVRETYSRRVYQEIVVSHRCKSL